MIESCRKLLEWRPGSYGREVLPQSSSWCCSVFFVDVLDVACLRWWYGGVAEDDVTSFNIPPDAFPARARIGSSSGTARVADRGPRSRFRTSNDDGGEATTSEVHQTATTTSPASRLPASSAVGSVSIDGFCNDHAHSPLYCTVRRDGARSTGRSEGRLAAT